LNVEWTNGTTLSGIWPSGSWLNVNTDGVSDDAEVSPVPVVVPVPVCVKAESSKDANCAAVGFEDESIDASEVPDEPRFDNPRLDRSDPSVVVVTPELVVVDVVPVVVDVVPFPRVIDPNPKLPVATIDRFRVPLVAVEKTGVRVIVVGAGVFDPIEKDDVVPNVPVVKVGIAAAEVMGVTLNAVGVVTEERLRDPPTPVEPWTPAVPARPVPVAVVPPMLVTPPAIPEARAAVAPPVLTGVPAGGYPDRASFNR
jgi:hypothetical protein